MYVAIAQRNCQCQFNPTCYWDRIYRDTRLLTGPINMMNHFSTYLALPWISISQNKMSMPIQSKMLSRPLLPYLYIPSQNSQKCNKDIWGRGYATPFDNCYLLLRKVVAWAKSIAWVALSYIDQVLTRIGAFLCEALLTELKTT